MAPKLDSEFLKKLKKEAAAAVADSDIGKEMVKRALEDAQELSHKLIETSHALNYRIPTLMLAAGQVAIAVSKQIGSSKEEFMSFMEQHYDLVGAIQKFAEEHKAETETKVEVEEEEKTEKTNNKKLQSLKDRVLSKLEEGALKTTEEIQEEVRKQFPDAKFFKTQDRMLVKASMFVDATYEIMDYAEQQGLSPRTASNDAVIVMSYVHNIHRNYRRLLEQRINVLMLENNISPANHKMVVCFCPDEQQGDFYIGLSSTKK